MLHRLLIFIHIILVLCTALSAAPKFPFPQQSGYPNGTLPKGISFKHVQDVYDIWLKGYYEEQGSLARIKFDTPSQSVSEGIAYGMLIMVYMDNQQNNTQGKFDKLWNYWKKFPSSGSLMHWKISGFNSVVESGSATDGDVDAALALVLAYHQWGDEKYLTGAKSIMSAMKNNDVSGNLLDGGDQWNAINPSYMSLVATQVFQDVEPGEGWESIQSGCYSHLKSNQNGSTGMWPNWTSGSPPGYSCPSCYGFDAARTPWRLAWAYVWYGHADAKTCCSKIVDWFKQKTGNTPGLIGQIYNLDGSINTGAGGNDDNIPTYLGPLTVAGMVDSKYQNWLDDGYTRMRSFGNSDDNYYNECIELLTMLLLTGNMPDLTKATPKTKAKLTVTISPEGAGTVTLSPSSGTYDINSSVTIKATPSDPSQYEFVGWGGDIEATGEETTVKMIGDLSVVATFKDNAAMDLVDDCEDNNSRTYLRSKWFTFNDSVNGGKSTITPLTTSRKGFTMTEGGYESEYAAKVTYSLDKGSFKSDPYVGIGFGLDPGNDSVDISEATALRFYYKGTFGDTTCAVKIESDAVTEEGANYSYFLTPSDNWREVNITWDQFQQPKWTKNPVKLDLTVIRKIQWQIQAKGGSGELWLDDIHLIGFFIDRPISVKPHITTLNDRNIQNPFSIAKRGNAFFVTTTLKNAGVVTISLFSLNGKRIGSAMSRSVNAGIQTYTLRNDLANVSPGSYLFNMETPEGTHILPAFLGDF